MLNTTYNYALTLFLPYVFSVFNANVIKINTNTIVYVLGSKFLTNTLVVN